MWAMGQGVAVLLAPATAVASLRLAALLAEQLLLIHFAFGCIPVSFPLLPPAPHDGLAAHPAATLRCHCAKLCITTTAEGA